MAAPSFSVEINGAQVPVKCHPSAPGLDLARCTEAKIFKEWVESVGREITVKEVLVSAVDYFGSRVGFLKIEADAWFHGVRIPGICFLRGGAVSILVVLHCEGEDYIILTRQPRVPVGRSGLLELPAGMLDDSGNFAGVAAKELREETGIVLKPEELTDLSAYALEIVSATQASVLKEQPPSCGVYMSGGGCDEFMRMMSVERTVARAELDAMRGRATGVMEEGEVIVLDIVPYNMAWRVCSDAKLLSSMFLYERKKRDDAQLV